MNGDLAKAYEILGLPENAPQEQLEKRYYVLLRKARAQSMHKRNGSAGAEASGETGSGADAGDSLNIAEINKAYKLIMDTALMKATAEAEQLKYGALKKLNVDPAKAEKLDNFFHYYKFHILVAIVSIGIVIFLTQSYLQHRQHQRELAKLPPADVSIMFLGDYASDDLQQMEQPLIAGIPDWRRVILTLNYSPTDFKSQYDMISAQKSIATLITDKADIYIVDKANFVKFLSISMFLNLDEIAELPSIKPFLTDENKYSGTIVEDEQVHLYGIEISGSKWIRDGTLHGGEMILTIRRNTPNIDQAVQALEWILNHPAPADQE